MTGKVLCNALFLCYFALLKRYEIMTGHVKWFDPKKGYGFITAEDGRDLFVHFSAVVRGGFKTLYEGERVVFDIADSERGATAVNVTVVEH